MSSTSRPQTTGAPNIQQGQSPAKPSQVDSTNQPPNVAQPLYQNNPNQQFIPNSIPLINPAAQQFQSQLSNFQQTAAFLRQTQFMHQQQQQQQQQQQSNSMESQMKNQQFHNLPDLLNFFLLSNPGINIPMPHSTQPSVQQQPPSQTPKTVSVSPSKSGQSQHTPRSATTGPRSIGVNINNAQTAELNNVTATSATSSATVSEQSAETSKQLLTTTAAATTTASPARSSSVSTVTTPSSTASDRLVEELKERTNMLVQGAKKSLQNDSALSNTTATSPSDSGSAIVFSPEATKSPSLPRRKQTNVTSPIKVNPITSPSIPTVQADSLSFSTPKKSVDVKSSTTSPSTPVAGVSSSISVPPNTPSTPLDKKVKVTITTKKETQNKSPKKSEPEPKTPSTSSGDRKPISTSSTLPTVPKASIQEPNSESEIKSKRNRTKTNLYQSPTPELVLATRMSVSEANKNSVSSKDKLIIFFANEFIAVRNDEGTFYLCQCVHNMFRTSKKCRIRWLNEAENSANTYQLTFYDNIDKECILTSVALESDADDTYKLTDNERERIDNILKKSIDVEKGILPRPEVTEENPDGLDISLYNDESQIKTDDPPTGHKRKSESSPKSASSPAKKIKQTKTKTSKDTPPPNRHKNNNSDSVESLKKSNKKTSKQTKKKDVQPQKSKQVKKNESTSSTSTVGSNTEAGKKKVAKTKEQKISTVSSSSSSVGPERTLRNRSKN